MKYIKFVKQSVLLAVVILLFNACDKVESPEPLGNNGQKIIRFLKYGGLGDNFASNSNLAFPSSHIIDSLELNMEYSAPQLPSTDITVTVAYNAAALAAYNEGLPLNKQYQKLPDSTYLLPNNKVTIKAGQLISEAFYLVVYPNKIDGGVNYMLPLSIVNISGGSADAKPASGTGTAYLHFIGNPIAGVYNVVGTRYNYNGAVNYNGGPIPPGFISSAPSPSPKSASAVDSKTVTIDYANLGNTRQYIITYDPDVDPLNIDVTFTPSFLAGISNVKVLTHTYDPILKQIHILSTYNNLADGTGSDRVIDEVLTRQ